jgi:dipeptidyl aminopeptidase/acylaminoacyl peptidase
VQPRDLPHLVTLSPPTLAPDGSRVVVAVTRPDLDADEYRGSLWSVPLDGGAPVRLTRGQQDTAPRFSPDGRWIAFLRREPKGKPQLHVLPTDGGEAIALTDLPGGAGAPSWSPDSRTLAFAARVPDEGRYGQDEDVTPDKEPPRRITGLQYRRDGAGFLIDNRSHVFVVDADGEGEVRQVTKGDHDSAAVSWSPDGAWLVFTSARHDDREKDINSDVFVVRPDGADLRQVTDSSLALDAPFVTPSGDTIVVGGVDTGPERNRWVGRNAGLFAVPFAGGSVTLLTDAERWHLAEGAPHVEEERALVLVEERGAVLLASVPLGGGDPEALTGGRHELLGVDAVGDTIVVSYADPGTTGEVGVVRDGQVHRLTDFGADLREHVDVREMHELTATAPDGQALHGFLVLPEGEGPHPVLLMIHGGPFTQYPWSFFDEAQVYAGAGYAVVYTNPRGSSGYGQAYGEHIRGDVGGRSAADLLALLDEALERPDLDADRVGVLGGSHGGFMTTWIVGHHSDRFRAAVSERAVNAIDSFTGSSDIGWGFADDLYAPDLE